MIHFSHTRGGTFELTLTFEDLTIPVDLTTWTITSQLRRRNSELVDNLVVTKLPQAGDTLGKFTITAAPATQTDWPLGDLFCDVKFVDADGRVYPSQTFIVRVIKEITA